MKSEGLKKNAFIIFVLNLINDILAHKKTNMKLNDFTANYEFKFSTVNNGKELITATEVIRKSDQKRMGAVKSTFDIFETSIKLEDSQTPASLINWDWDKLIEETKRSQMDHFAILIPIDDFYPRNHETEINNL